MKLLLLLLVILLTHHTALGDNCSAALGATLCGGGSSNFEYPRDELDDIDCGGNCTSADCCTIAGYCSLYSCPSNYRSRGFFDRCTSIQSECSDSMCCIQKCVDSRVCTGTESIISEYCDNYACTHAECCKPRTSCPTGSDRSGDDRCECRDPTKGTYTWKELPNSPWLNYWDGSCLLGCTFGPIAGTSDENGNYYSCNSNTHGGTCTPTCNTGYRIVNNTTPGNITLDCSTVKGHYNASAGGTLFCEPLPCIGKPISASPNGSYVNCVGLSSGDMCEFTCDDGFYASPSSGEFEVTCLAASWSAYSGKCLNHWCRDGPWGVVDPHANYRSCEYLRTGDTCYITCAAGYHPSVDTGFELLCHPILSAGNFFQPSVTCVPDKCDPQPTTPQPRVDYDVCKLKSTEDRCEPVCELSIRDYYHMSFPGINLHCVDGDWDDVTLKCLPNDCSNGIDSKQPNTHTDHCDHMKSGDTCIATCDEGYVLEPASGFTLECRAPSTSIGYTANATCNANTCSQPNIIVNYVIYDSCVGSHTSESCQPECVPGWTVNGTVDVLICSENGYFNASGVSCVPNKCDKGPLVPQSNASYIACTGMHSGLYCSIVCDEGYTPSSPQLFLSCDSVGNFDATDVECLPNSCLSPTWHTGSTFPGLYDPYNNQPVASYNLCDGKETGNLCKPDCRTGYTSRILNFTLVCSDSGEYQALDDQCTVNNCSAGPIPDTETAFGTYEECNAKHTDERCQPNCFIGYELIPTSVVSMNSSEDSTDSDFNLVCSESNTYNASDIDCVPRSCSNGPSWPEGRNPGPFRASDGTSVISYDDCLSNKTNDLCSPVCDEGYDISHKNFLLNCNGNNTFLVPHSMNCVPRNCSGGPSNPEMLSDVTQQALAQTCNPKSTDLTCELDCGLYHARVGKFRMACNEKNQYFATSVCVGKLCTGASELSRDRTADYSDCRNRRTGDYCDIKCQAGYEIQRNKGDNVANSTLGPLHCDSEGEFAAYGVRCTVTICEIGKYVMNKRCYPCPEGTSTTAPQNASIPGRTYCVPLDDLRGTGFMVGRLAVLSRLGCEHEVAKPDDLPWQLHPARFSLGSGRWANFVGAIVGNLVTLIGFSAVLRLFALLIEMWDKVSPSKSKYTLHFPGILIMPYSFLSPGFVMGGFRVCSAYFAGEAAFWEFAIGIFGVAFSIGVPLFVYYRVLREKSFDAKLVKAKCSKTARFFWGGQFRWVNTTKRPFVEKYGAVYDCFKENSTYFALLDLLLTVVLTLITTIPISDIGVCNIRNWIVVGILCAIAGLFLWKWPLLCQFLNNISFFNQVSQAVGIAMLSQRLFSVADIFLNFSALLAAVKFTFDILMALRPEAQQSDNSEVFDKKTAFSNFSDMMSSNDGTNNWEPLLPIGSDSNGEQVEFANFDGITPELLTEIESEQNQHFDI